METKILTHPETKLVGREMKMSFAENKTAELWKSFMPVRQQILNTVHDTPLYSLQIYPPLFFEDFEPRQIFSKWSAVEVTEFSLIPSGMGFITIPEGLYAVFFYKGPVSEAASVFQYILGTWLPASLYELDARPHFEKLGKKFDKDSADSEEEIWIPIREKQNL